MAVVALNPNKASTYLVSTLKIKLRTAFSMLTVVSVLYYLLFLVNASVTWLRLMHFPKSQEICDRFSMLLHNVC